MFYSLQREAIITHAVSQLTNRWLSVPRPNLFEKQGEREESAEIPLRDWLRYMEDQVSAGSSAPWAETVRKDQLSLIGLATVIFDNLREVALAGGTFLDFFHPAYPYLLKHIPDPPAALSSLGDLALFDRAKIAVVGSRKASAFAFQETRELGCEIAKSGGVVVSGGALGCDSAAHLGALDSGLSPVPTIVVFAGGLHKFYPQALQSLFRELKQGSALFLSERLWSFPALPHDFPIRNRIIAGLSTHLALMQAGLKSGALKTATYALEQGRDVYALLHDTEDIKAAGSRQLIEEGAFPFRSAADFFSLKELF